MVSGPALSGTHSSGGDLFLRQAVGALSRGNYGGINEQCNVT